MREHKPGRGFLWLALLWASGTCLSAQGRAGGLSESAGSEDFPKRVETASSPSIKRLEETFANKDYLGAVEGARALIAALPADSPDLEALLYIEGLSL